MHYVLLLKLSSNTFFTEITRKPTSRMLEHHLGHVPETQFHRPVKLVSYQKFSKLSQAIQHHNSLKLRLGHTSQLHLI